MDDALSVHLVQAARKAVEDGEDDRRLQRRAMAGHAAAQIPTRAAFRDDGDGAVVEVEDACARSMSALGGGG
jgi:hypothetical protein